MREGGSYIVEKDGSLTLIERTRPQSTVQPQEAQAPVSNSEESSDENEE